MASKFEPRPESRIPSLFIAQPSPRAGVEMPLAMSF